MKSLTSTPSTVHLKSITRTAWHLGFESTTHHRLVPRRLFIQRVSPYDLTNINAITCIHVARARHELLSASLILAQQQDTKKSCTGDNRISANNDHVTVNESSIYPTQLSKSLSIDDLPLELMHGSPLRVAYHGVPGTYSEAAALKAYPSCEAIPCHQFEMAFLLD